MAELSQQEEQELIEALVAIDWTWDIDGESLQVIRERCRCSLNEARGIMEDLYGRNLIRYDSDKSGELPAGVPTPTSFWKWKRPK
jgi:hypothetical protein